MTKGQEQEKMTKDQEFGGRKRPRKASARKDQKLQERLERLERQVEELTGNLQRERADFTNFKNRAQADREQLLGYAKTEIISQLLPLFDDLERALSYAPEELGTDPWAEGVRKVHEKVQHKLQELGVGRIEALGEPFDPELHEAVGFEDGGGTDEIVIDELRPGYMLGDTVLRPAMVKVGKTTAKSKQPEPEKDND